MTLPLHSLLAGPSYDKAQLPQELLAIHFRREDLTDEFILLFFHPEGEFLRRTHPFAARGVEAVLTRNELILLVHSGVTLHLRNDVPTWPWFRTFRNDDVIGVVKLVVGNFLVSRDRDTIREKLGDVWVHNSVFQRCVVGVNCFQRADGSYTGSGTIADLVPVFPPRVVE